MANIDAALADLRLQNKPNISATAKKHGCDRTTLSKRFHNITKSKESANNLMRLLDHIQSKALIKYINDLTERGLPPTTAMVQNLAAGIVGRQPGNYWAACWLAAYKDKVKFGYLLPINTARKKADLVLYYSLYFELLGKKIIKYNIQLENIYNINEKGFLINFLKKTRRIFSKQAFNSSRVKNIS